MHIKTTLFIIFICFVSSQQAVAKKISFIVGINEYKNLSSERQLSRAVNDAMGVAQIINDQHGMNYLGKVMFNLTREKFNHHFISFVKKIEKNDIVFFFFSGHGVEIGGVNYLLPSDVPYQRWDDQDYLKSESISLEHIINEIDRKNPRITIIILDACRNNPFVPPEYYTKGFGNLSNGLNTNSSPPEGMFIMYAASSKMVARDKTSSDDKSKYSVFTRHLLPLLKQPGLSISELATTVREQVIRFAKENGFKQRPAYRDELSTTKFCLNGCENVPEKYNGDHRATNNNFYDPLVQEAIEEFNKM